VREVVAEQVEERTGAVIGARTVRGPSAVCFLEGNEIAVGIVDTRTEAGPLESLLFRDGSVVYVDETANPVPAHVAGPIG
jgi:hypothetical protein